MITGNARILWSGYTPSVGKVGDAHPCRVVLGTCQRRAKEKDPFEEVPEVVYEVAHKCDSMGGSCYESQPLQDIPIEFFLHMEKQCQRP